MKKIILLSILSFITVTSIYSQAYPDRHSTSFTDAWMSCEETESPNIKRDPGHWIMYNFGSQYSLHESTIWNFNVPDTTDRGMRDIVIDYSIDGENWTELGEYSIPEAPGSAFYQGDAGPNFDGIVARYVLISILNTHGDTECVGMSEIKINATIATSTNAPAGELDLELTASPNPASEFSIIEVGEFTSDMKYSLTDMSGKLLKQGKLPSKEFKLNTASITSGIYSLIISNTEGQKAILINIIND